MFVPVAICHLLSAIYHLNMLPALLFSLAFLLPTWWMWRRGWRIWSAIPLLIGLLLLGFTIAIQLAIVNRSQAALETAVLVEELRQGDLFRQGDLADPQRALFLASTGSQALYAATRSGAANRNDIDSTLAYLAARVTDRKLFPQWNKSREWDRHLFFLAHAGAVIAHYQLATGDVATHATDLARIGDHLGQRIRKGRYKHLISRPTEEFFRPADNAAGLYTIYLYDRIAGTNYLAETYKDWTGYLRDELYHAESRLPCAAFNDKDCCQLEPSAVATGLYITYRAAASPDQLEENISWREWLHYFRKTNLSPFTASIRHNMRDGQPTRFCNLGAQPLECERFERAVGLWAAAEYEGDYTYFRLFSTVIFRQWFGEPDNYGAMSPSRRTTELTRLALRTNAGWRIGRLGE